MNVGEFFPVVEIPLVVTIAVRVKLQMPSHTPADLIIKKNNIQKICKILNRQ